MSGVPSTATPSGVFVGIVKSAEYDSSLDTMFYNVEVTFSGFTYALNCRQMAKFGDVYNYEEWGLRNFKAPSLTKKPVSYKARVGEVVIVAHIGGNANDGIILGSLKHPGRKTKLTEKSIEYVSEFNGLRTTIDDAGAYKVTFNGTPTSVSSLKAAAATGGVIAPAVYDPVKSGSYLTFEKDGSFEVSDNHPFVQTVRLDKSNGLISIASGNVQISISKKDGSFAVSAMESKIDSTKSLTISTLSTSIESTKEFKLKSAKIAIGFGSVELIDSILKVIDAIGGLVINSPNGPCSPIKNAPTWTQIEQIKTKLSTIKGSL
jgi:hypothetical protein